MNTRQMAVALAASVFLITPCTARMPAGLQATGEGTAEMPNESDPGYQLYKEGYSLILEERWAEARKKFAELVAKHPTSQYVDDAQYWSAYSLKYSDREGAITAYRKFIKERPESSYYDDAVADLTMLQGAALTPVPGAPNVPRMAPVLPHGFAIPVAPNMQNLERQLKRQMRHMGRLGFAPFASTPFPRTGSEEELDDKTRLTMDALYALGEMKVDEKSYTTLRDVALDMHQPRPVRETAMDALSGFTKHDITSVFVEIAKKDTNRDMQGYAIDYIGEQRGDRNQRVSVLADLFHSLPKGREDQRETIIYTIADVGNDHAVEFLKDVALTDDNYDLRREAVYYLGNIGGEKAREALYEILRKSDR